MTDNLDTLSDEKLSEVFAVEVGGWRNIQPNPFHSLWHCGFNDSEGKNEQSNGGSPWGIANFATDANAVLPYVSAYLHKSLFSRRRRFWSEVAMVASPDSCGGNVYAYPDVIGLLIQQDKLPKAFCIAIIRAHRSR